MRALRPLLADPTDVVYQGEQMRSAPLMWPVAGVTTPSVIGSPDPGVLMQGAQTVAPMTDEGPTPPQWCRLGSRLNGWPRANGGIMTSAGFMPVFANECSIKRFRQSDRLFNLSGVTRDSANSPLANCIVKLFGPSNEFLGQTISDGSGNYSFPVANNVGPFFVAAWDVATGLISGASPRTLSPAEV